MSNVGRPLCQLQMDKAGVEKSRKPYNHIVRMTIGDAVESITEIFLKAAGANITGGKNKVSHTIAGQEINGEDDIEIDHEVWDIKSCSPWAFTNKWSKGAEGLLRSDDFGYAGQLIGYSDGQAKKPGGWIVINKSTGEIAVVPADFTWHDFSEIRDGMKHTVESLSEDRPFERCFKEEDEFFNRSPTGNKVLPQNCVFCDFKGSCWPNAQLKPQAMSKAKSPKSVWYSEYKEG